MNLLRVCAAVSAISLAGSIGTLRAQEATNRSPATGGQVRNAAQDQPTHLEPVELRALERGVQRQVSKVRELTDREYAKLVKAARDYASQLAGDDNAKFALLATQALSQAIATEKKLLGGTAALAAPRGVERALVPPTVSSEAPTPPSILSLPEFQKNLRDLLERGSKEELKLAPVAPGLRVVGGRRANKDEFPDCVCIGSRSDDGDEYCCTGTLIGKNVVVTAGHCLPCTGDSSVIYIGTNTKSPGITYTGKAIRHPNYGQGGLHNDLTVIILDSDVMEVQPRRIAATDEINRATFVRVVGFGNSDVSSTSGFGIKRIADVPVASTSCSGASDAGTLGCDAKLELVAGMVGLSRDSCNGDSGGPIYVLVGDDPTKPESWAVAGATSRATRTAITACGDGGIYERLDQFLDSFVKTIPGARF
jgi:hypothetical protein